MANALAYNIAVLITAVKCFYSTGPMLFKPVANVVKLFTMVIYCHFMVITAVILFYNTE